MLNYHNTCQLLGYAHRLEQELTYDALNSSLKRVGEASLYQVDTGTGKSLAIALSALSLLQNSEKLTQVIIATSTVTLAKDMLDQLEAIKDCSNGKQTLGLLIGAAHYISPERLNMAVNNAQNQDNADLALLKHLLQWEETIDEFISDYGQLPFGLKPSDICQTQNSKSESWVENREFERLSDVVVTTHAMIAVDMKKRSPLFKADCDSYLIIDEADQFTDMLKSQSYSRLNLKRLYSEVYADVRPKAAKAFESAIEQCEIAAQGKEFNPSRTEAIDIVRGLAAVISNYEKELPDLLEYLQYWLLQNVTSPNLGTGVSTKNKEPAIVALNPYYSRTFGRYAFENYKSIALLSGTLSIAENVEDGVKWCIKDLGLTNTVGKIFEFSPHKFGELELSLCQSTQNGIYLSAASPSVINPLWVSEQAKNITTTLTGRALILTSSHQESELFAKQLLGFASLHKKGEKINVAIDEFRNDPTKKYLITAAGHTGLNLKDSHGNMMISDIYITRLGFPPPNDQLRAICELYEDDRYHVLRAVEHFDGLCLVTRKIKQSLGRGIRGEDNKIHLCILDHRFPPATDFGPMKTLKNSIPKRFFNKYAAARIINKIEEQEIVL